MMRWVFLALPLGIVAACSSFGSSPDETPADGGGAQDSALEVSEDGGPDVAGRAVLALARNQQPLGIAATDSTVYWTEMGPGKLHIGAMDGSNEHALSETFGATFAVRVIDTNVFFTDASKHTIWRTALDGSQLTTFTTPQHGVLSFAVTTNALVAVTNAPDIIALDRLSGTQFGGPNSFATPFDVVTRGDTVFWTESGGHTVHSALSTDLVGTTISATETGCELVAATRSQVYWTISDGKGGGVIRRTAGVGLDDVQFEPSPVAALAADTDDEVFWLTADGRVMRKRGTEVSTIATGPAPTTGLAQRQAHALALTARYIAWVAADQVLRTTR
jgi:hypothetical protein